MPDNTRALNVVLRAATLASRFLFIFFLARFLEPSSLGLYGLFTATMGYSGYLLGLDFYTFTTREVLKRERGEWGGLLKSQGALTLLLYAVFLPLLTLIFVNELLPWRMASWFFALLILEHLNQELNRFLVAISEQLLASVVLFLRSGTWALAVIGLMAIEPGVRSLDYVFGAWTIAALVALFAGVFRLTQLRIGGWHQKIDWGWIKKGLKISIKLLIATLAIRAVFTVDRYWIQSLCGLDVVGAYVLFMGIGGTLLAFLDAGVFAFCYPGLISAHSSKNPKLFSYHLRKLLFQTCFLSTAFAVVSWLLLPVLLGWIGNHLYADHKYIYPWLLFAMILNALSMVPHYGLYAQGVDAPIIKSHIFGFLFFVFITWWLSIYYPVLAVPMGLCCSFALILLWKTVAFLGVTPLTYRSMKIA